MRFCLLNQKTITTFGQTDAIFYAASAIQPKAVLFS
jgi:hypothetical protein